MPINTSLTAAGPIYYDAVDTGYIGVRGCPNGIFHPWLRGGWRRVEILPPPPSPPPSSGGPPP